VSWPILYYDIVRIHEMPTHDCRDQAASDVHDVGDVIKVGKQRTGWRKVMAEGARLIDPDKLVFIQEKIGGVVLEATTIDVGDFEARFSRWSAGTKVPRHAHSTAIMTVVLRGKVKTVDGQELSSGTVYSCGGVNYGSWEVIETVTFVTFQPKGSKVVMNAD
jgi:hypothetical protein